MSEEERERQHEQLAANIRERLPPSQDDEEQLPSHPAAGANDDSTVSPPDNESATAIDQPD